MGEMTYINCGLKAYTGHLVTEKHSMRDKDLWLTPLRKRSNDAKGLSPSHSGRQLVILAIVVLAATSSALYWSFLSWRKHYRQNVAYANGQISPVLKKLFGLHPPKVDPMAWKQAVMDSHDMVALVIASGILDRAGLTVLIKDVSTRFRETSDSTALRDLSGLWDDMETRAGPILARSPERQPRIPRRPKLLEPRRIRRVLR